MDEKFTLTFDKPPAFICVAEDATDVRVYLHGNEVYGFTGVKFNSNVDEFPSYEISGVAVSKT